ncbi:15813_t:CDS:2, partial [Gigaspora rosea]
LINLEYEVRYELSLPIIITDFEQLGLSIEYEANTTFCIKLYQLIAFAFLLSTEILATFDQIKSLMLSNTTFLLLLWSIFELIIQGYSRTQNFIKDWHYRWNNIVRRAHIG